MSDLALDTTFFFFFFLPKNKVDPEPVQSSKYTVLVLCVDASYT